MPTFVAFASAIASKLQVVAPPERFQVGKSAAYLHCATGILESKAGEALLGKAGKAAITTNWATVLKLQALASEPDAQPFHHCRRCTPERY
jgi:hypothetical protein